MVTIFYAIAGIPLMLLCLSNLGDTMAHSFKFFYKYVSRWPSLPRHECSSSTELRPGGSSNVDLLASKHSRYLCCAMVHKERRPRKTRSRSRRIYSRNMSFGALQASSLPATPTMGPRHYSRFHVSLTKLNNRIEAFHSSDLVEYEVE